MKRMMIVLCAVAFAATMQDCKRDKETITVASEQADCIGVGPQKCLLVKYEGSERWEFWYSGIEGFDYEPGFEYVLKVKKETVENPAADQSSIKYILVKTISKTRKDSEEMPQGVTDGDVFIDDAIIL